MAVISFEGSWFDSTIDAGAEQVTRRAFVDLVDFVGRHDLSSIGDLTTFLKDSGRCAAEAIARSELERRRALVLRDAWLISEDEHELVRRLNQMRGSCPRSRRGGAAALASVGDVRALAWIDIDLGWHRPAIPEAWTFAAGWLRDD